MTTVREIADFAGVSKSTVSLVLNNKNGVSDEMRELVMNAVSQLEAMQADTSLPERISQDIATEQKLQTVSIMVLHPPVLRSSYVFSEVLQGIQSAAELYKVQLRLVANERDASAQHVSHLYLKDDFLRPDGVLVFGAQQHEPLVENVIERGIPCVVLGREAKKYKVSGIARDEAHYACLLTKHLINLGHERIAFVGRDTEYDFTNNRILGYQQAMQSVPLSDAEKDDLLQLGNSAITTQQVLDVGATAIVYVNDSFAIEGVSAIHERGLQIPEDVAIASFDNTEFAQTYHPPLTSIAYNLFREGQWAVKILLDQIRFPFIETTQQIFKGELIVRESTVRTAQ